MGIFIFVIVICALIVAHEFGHFVAAKLSGMRVDEFGLGYPPRALTIAKVGETVYTLNWLPFGGFVKIYGEDLSSAEPSAHRDDTRSFSAKPRLAQALVLVSGVAMNVLLAYVLIVGTLVAGTPRALSENELPIARDATLAVAGVLSGTPAARAGLLPGDTIIGAKDAAGEWRATDPKSFSAFVAESGGSEITLDLRREGKEFSISATPATSIATADPSRYALGVEVATVGVVPLPFHRAVVEGAMLTWGVVALTAEGLLRFFYAAFTLSADLSQVAGPIGIAGAVGSASAQGFGNLLSIMAVISVNLALINLVPVPALDGGRLFFVIIESVIRRPLGAGVARAANAVGFAFLVFLMLAVTAHDISTIIG